MTSLNYKSKDINYIPSQKIPIKSQILNNIVINNNKNEYSLKENSFDPCKSSPPNDFMNKLQKRIDSLCYLDIKDNSFENI